MQIYRHLAKRKIKKNGGWKIKKRGPPAARSPAGGRQPERIGREEERMAQGMREREGRKGAGTVADAKVAYDVETGPRGNAAKEARMKISRGRESQKLTRLRGKYKSAISRVPKEIAQIATYETEVASGRLERSGNEERSGTAREKENSDISTLGSKAARRQKEREETQKERKSRDKRTKKKKENAGERRDTREFIRPY